MKTLNNTSVEEVKKQISDVEVFGDGDTFALLCKASSKEQGWMKSTKVCNLHNGCLVQVSTQQGDNVAEALTFVPDVNIDTDHEPRRLVRTFKYYNDNQTVIDKMNNILNVLEENKVITK